MELYDMKIRSFIRNSNLHSENRRINLHRESFESMRQILIARVYRSRSIL